MPPFSALPGDGCQARIHGLETAAVEHASLAAATVMFLYTPSRELLHHYSVQTYSADCGVLCDTIS